MFLRSTWNCFSKDDYVITSMITILNNVIYKIGSKKDENKVEKVQSGWNEDDIIFNVENYETKKKRWINILSKNLQNLDNNNA